MPIRPIIHAGADNRDLALLRCRPITTWAEFAEAAPELASSIQHRMEASRYSLLATIRADGFPRISGVVAHFGDGRLRLAMRTSAAMAADLRREPRIAFHSGPVEGEGPLMDAKLQGTAAEETDPRIVERFLDSLPHGAGGDVALFTIALSDDESHHVITSWKVGEQGPTVRIR